MGDQMSALLAGKTAIVTGAAGGIGRAIADCACREGAVVFCVDIDESALQRVADGITERYGAEAAVPMVVDLTDFGAVEEMVEQISLRAAGAIDVLFANAGSSRGEARNFLELDEASWDTMIERNLTTAFNTGLHVARKMAASGGGAIVYTSSQLSIVARPKLSHYIAAKGAVAQLVRGMALDLASSGIRVNAVAPGPTEHENNRERFASDEMREYHEVMIPLGRVGRPEEIAEAACFLASERSSFTTGATLFVDGGYTAI